MTSCTVFSKFSHILLISPFFVHFSLFQNKVVWPLMATAGVCELCSLFAIFTIQLAKYSYGYHKSADRATLFRLELFWGVNTCSIALFHYFMFSVSQGAFQILAVLLFIEVKTMQRPGTEAIRTQTKRNDFIDSCRLGQFSLTIHIALNHSKAIILGLYSPGT